MRLALAIALLLLGAALWFWLGWDEKPPASKQVRLVTTTSTENSGLLKYLLDPWRRETGIEVQVIPVGTGQALALAARGDADVVLVHARAREDAFVASGDGIDRRDVMWNDFVLVGPPEDPAGVRGMNYAVNALRKIHDQAARFVSRGDDSGTHIRERALWRETAVDPEGGSWYAKAGQGMGPCLTIADQTRAYTLTDRGTFLAVRAGKQLEVLVEGAPSLRNPYGIILVNPVQHPHVHAENARRLQAYLVSEEGQRRIGAFRVDGEVLFHPVSAN